jgi:hypothetical protein
VSDEVPVLVNLSSLPNEKEAVYDIRTRLIILEKGKIPCP